MVIILASSFIWQGDPRHSCGEVGYGEDKWRACKPACLVRERLFGSPFYYCPLREGYFSRTALKTVDRLRSTPGQSQGVMTLRDGNTGIGTIPSASAWRAVVWTRVASKHAFATFPST